ncbi:uncharacterized protein LOC122503117 isoform X3 [Leptopilina heterotoma]|uniref:uncharacterized protein LOC122503117 isoform X3 n=1 Tax=Leptopilina heterotoma TaxID=63436 RepID=UPI001CA86F02|nr:uncharacterized protein LOC122503117 isoform X3 [Leptopilina heterotoma]
MRRILDEATLEKLWKNLDITFGLNKHHPEDEIQITTEGENITLNIDNRVFYHTEKRMLTDRTWDALPLWLDEQILQDQPAVMPRTFSGSSVTELMKIDEENESTKIDEERENNEDEKLYEKDETGGKLVKLELELEFLYLFKETMRTIFTEQHSTIIIKKRKIDNTIINRIILCIQILNKAKFIQQKL